MLAYGSVPPNPNHGFGVDPHDPWGFKEDVNSDSLPYLWADASYDAWDLGSLDRAADFQIDRAKTDYDAKGKEMHNGVLVLKREPARLGTLKAVHLVLRVRPEVGPEYVEESFVAFRKRRDIVYSLVLRASVTDHPRYRALLRSLAAAFRLQPLPPPG